MKLNTDRLHERIAALAEIGKTSDDGACRIALTDTDKQGRDLLVNWFRETGLKVEIDEIGNIFATLAGRKNGTQIMMGSHIDTVGNGGHLDGCYGVIAALEVIETFIEQDKVPQYDLTVAIFTNEEGVRFQPDMMGSLVYVNGMSVENAHDTISTDGITLKEELTRTGYLGSMKCGLIRPYAFLELHIEQGPILEKKGITIGAVDNVQGISWTDVVFKGQSNHAGTTPMEMRHDAGFAASKLTVAVREIANVVGSGQVATVGVINPKPNLINVVPGEAQLTVDLRNSDAKKLKIAEFLLHEKIKEICEDEEVTCQTDQLVRFDPVKFDSRISDLIATTANYLNLSCVHINSGAGHDAQMMARICPTAMIFVPSRDGISHNPKEYTDPEFLDAGLEVLFETVYRLDKGYLD